jgi:hypothetical protein
MDLDLRTRCFAFLGVSETDATSTWVSKLTVFAASAARLGLKTIAHSAQTINWPTCCNPFAVTFPQLSQGGNVRDLDKRCVCSADTVGIVFGFALASGSELIGHVFMTESDSGKAAGGPCVFVLSWLFCSCSFDGKGTNDLDRVSALDTVCFRTDEPHVVHAGHWSIECEVLRSVTREQHTQWRDATTSDCDGTDSPALSGSFADILEDALSTESCIPAVVSVETDVFLPTDCDSATAGIFDIDSPDILDSTRFFLADALRDVDADDDDDDACFFAFPDVITDDDI